MSTPLKNSSLFRPFVNQCNFPEQEEAILEFEEVIKKYPRGNKLPDAMLKQAFSFLAINDTNSAKLLLQKILTKLDIMRC